MNVLVIGSGGREHALCWALSRSDGIGSLFCAPGNAGIGEVASCVQVDWEDTNAVISFCHKRDIALVVIGPEAPLAAGLADDLRDVGLRVVGPSKDAAQLEASKVFMREICKEVGIPSPSNASFEESEKAKLYVGENFREGEKIVVKADGLAAGKGVVIASSHDEAYQTIDEMFNGKFGESSARVLIEKCLEGKEASLFYLCDNEVALPFGGGRDYKRIGDDDRGANTGGMGSYAPVGELTQEVCAEVKEKIVMPTLRAMAQRGMPFSGFLYAGVMLTSDGVKLLEFNVRLGDPETQVVLPRLKSNFLKLLLASCSGAGSLKGQRILWESRPCVTVVMASKGYPGAYQRGAELSGLEKVAAMKDVQVFHAGTVRDRKGKFRTAGGRVLAVSALGKDLDKARRHAYRAVRRISWQEGICRHDIAKKIIIKTVPVKKATIKKMGIKQVAVQQDSEMRDVADRVTTKEVPDEKTNVRKVAEFLRLRERFVFLIGATYFLTQKSNKTGTIR